MNTSLEESYRLCGEIARRTARNFYYAFVVMPREKRRAMCAIYAFMRRSDDIADDATNSALAMKGLRRWRAEVDAALAGVGGAGVSPAGTGGNMSGLDARATIDPILPALADTVQRYRIPPHHFHQLLDGTEMDQTKTRYETFDELCKYCYHVASVVGLIVLPVFGYKDDAAKEPAEACGIAFQLTNILRDVKEDAQMGRIYLPLEDLRRFGVEESEIIGGQMTPQFIELMRFEAARAREYYVKARPLLGMISEDSRGTLAVMTGIYGGILDKIERSGFAVFGSRIRLSPAEKLWIVAKNWVAYC
ncbi:MAG: presqualene diphosphate synthase HpnD [Verrucomicrobiia bacterium]